jgi:hypothetical protein
VEVWTRAYGWLETHTLTDWRTAQIERLGMEGAGLGTMSCTGLASPRILVPYGENVPLGATLARAVRAVEPALRADSVARWTGAAVYLANTRTGPRRINRLLHWKMKTDIDWAEEPPQWAPENFLYENALRVPVNMSAPKLDTFLEDEP